MRKFSRGRAESVRGERLPCLGNQRFRGPAKVVHGRKLAYIHGQKMTCAIFQCKGNIYKMDIHLINYIVLNC